MSEDDSEKNSDKVIKRNGSSHIEVKISSAIKDTMKYNHSSTSSKDIPSNRQEGSD